MKTILVKLQEDCASGEYVVQSFENTVQISVGQRIPKNRVAEWCTRGGIKVAVTGEWKPKEETEDMDQPTRKPARATVDLDLHDALEDDEVKAANPF